jgi:hypothetical protein
LRLHPGHQVGVVLHVVLKLLDLLRARSLTLHSQVLHGFVDQRSYFHGNLLAFHLEVKDCVEHEIVIS